MPTANTIPAHTVLFLWVQAGPRCRGHLLFRSDFYYYVSSLFSSQKRNAQQKPQHVVHPNFTEPSPTPTLCQQKLHQSTMWWRCCAHFNILFHNSRTQHRTIKNLTSTNSLSLGASRDTGHAPFRLDNIFFSQFRKISKTYFRELVLVFFAQTGPNLRKLLLSTVAVRHYIPQNYILCAII